MPAPALHPRMWRHRRPAPLRSVPRMHTCGPWSPVQDPRHRDPWPCHGRSSQSWSASRASCRLTDSWMSILPSAWKRRPKQALADAAPTCIRLHDEQRHEGPLEETAVIGAATPNDLPPSHGRPETAASGHRPDVRASGTQPRRGRADPDRRGKYLIRYGRFEPACRKDTTNGEPWRFRPARRPFVPAAGVSHGGPRR
jgi:hypothetical protein